MIILGGGGNGKDHWGWGGGTVVSGVNGVIIRKKPATWAPVDAKGRVTLKFKDARSNQVAGVVRCLVHRHSKTCGFLVKFSDSSMGQASSHQIMEDRYGYLLQEVHHPPERG